MSLDLASRHIYVYLHSKVTSSQVSEELRLACRFYFGFIVVLKVPFYGGTL